jgi:hypothetical protein
MVAKANSDKVTALLDAERAESRLLAADLRAQTHQLGFLLSAGYFKAAKRFFPPSTFHGGTSITFPP